MTALEQDVRRTRFEQRLQRLAERDERRRNAKRAPKGSPLTRSPQPGGTPNTVPRSRCVYCGGRVGRPDRITCHGHGDLPALEPAAIAELAIADADTWTVPA